jgi:hypothetical protein
MGKSQADQQIQVLMQGRSLVVQCCHFPRRSKSELVGRAVTRILHWTKLGFHCFCAPASKLRLKYWQLLNLVRLLVVTQKP